VDTHRIAFAAAQTSEAQAELAALKARYGDTSIDDADVIVALGGDGFMLRTLHRHIARGLPVYGVKVGTVGFLMNPLQVDELPERLARAQSTLLHPLVADAVSESGTTSSALAFNEVSLLRQTKQIAHLRISLNGSVKLDELMCDGIIVSTPAGSTAYNFSAYGPILPLGSQLLAMTPLSPFRPRRWRGAIIPATTDIRIDILDPYKRPVSATADSNEMRDVVEVRVRESREQTMTLLFDPEHNLEQRVLDEQFEL
jgi:NAD+ kinase